MKCPICSKEMDKHESIFYNEITGKQGYICFSCGISVKISRLVGKSKK